MKKLVIGLICLFQVMCLPNISVKANETTRVHSETTLETTTVETTVTTQEPTTESTAVEAPKELVGASVADYLVADHFYQIIVKNAAGEVVYQKDDAIFPQNDLEKLQSIIKNSSHLYMDLGDGQYALAVASLRLVNQTMTFIYDDVIGYSAVFHEGVVTNSGMIISDATDPVIETIAINQPDISGWIVDQPTNLTSDMLIIALNDQQYWATMPYRVGTNGELLDESNTIYLGAFTITGSPYNLHLNIVPKTDAPKEKVNTQQSNNKRRLALADQTTVQADNEVSATDETTEQADNNVAEADVTTVDSTMSQVEHSEAENQNVDNVEESNQLTTDSSVANESTIINEVSDNNQTRLNAEATSSSQQAVTNELQPVVPNDNRPKLPSTGEKSSPYIFLVIPLIAIGLALIGFNKKEKK